MYVCYTYACGIDRSCPGDKAMSKKDRDQVVGGTEVSVEDEAAKLEARKAKKKELSKAWKERKAQEKAEQATKAKKLLEELKSKGYFDTLDADLQAFVTGLTSQGGGNAVVGSTFSRMFGNNPPVGTSVTLKEAFNKTLKGKSAIDAYVKKWAEKGIVVSFEKNDADILESTYTLTAIGAASDGGLELAM